MAQTKKKLIFLIDDDTGDQKLITRSILKFDPNIKVEKYSDGAEAINFFENQKKNPSLDSVPDLILLDLNMPKVNGFEVLKYIKADIYFRKIPLIAFTTSSLLTSVIFVFTGSLFWDNPILPLFKSALS